MRYAALQIHNLIAVGCPDAVFGNGRTDRLDSNNAIYRGQIHAAVRRQQIDLGTFIELSVAVFVYAVVENLGRAGPYGGQKVVAVQVVGYESFQWRTGALADVRIAITISVRICIISDRCQDVERKRSARPGCATIFARYLVSTGD